MGGPAASRSPERDRDMSVSGSSLDLLARSSFRRRPIRAALAVTVSLAVPASLAAQSPPSFQLVSIRKAAPVIPPPGQLARRPPPVLTVLSGGRFEARSVSLEDLVRVAYGYEHRDPRHGVIDSGVSWAGRELFDVTASIDGDWTKPSGGDRIPVELRLLLRGLLEERFTLKARIAMKRLDVYALRGVKGEPPTPGLSRSTGECVGPYTDPTSIDANGKPPCTNRMMTDRIEVGALTMVQFADLLSTRAQLVDRPIVDDTGLEGTYDVRLTTGLRASSPSSPSAVMAADNAFREYSGAGFFMGNSQWAPAVRRALKEQLGLELQKAKLPIPTLRIESARKPSED